MNLQNNDPLKPAEGRNNDEQENLQVTPQTGATADPSYRQVDSPDSGTTPHQAYELGQTPQQPTQNPQPPQPSYYQTGAPGVKSGRSPRPQREQTRLRMTIVPVLVSILLTFSFTLGLFYALYAQGILAPAFGSNDTNSTNGDGTGNTSSGIELSVDSSDPATQMSAQKLATILELIQDNYYQELSDKEILDAISMGFPEGLESPFTYYLTAEDFEAMLQSLESSYVGIGATVGWNVAGYNEIIDVTPDGPAEEGGVLPGDIPVEVNGQNVEDFQDPSQLAAIVRGEEGTDVEIKFYRPSQSNYVTIKMVRRTVITVAVSHKMLDNDIGYIRITSFITDLLPQFKASVDALVDAGAKHIVFDLRNNPGGNAQSLIDVLDYLLPEGEIARTVGRENGEPISDSWMSDANFGVPESMRYAVLMNNNSASASELFAGALRDWNKAVIIGQQSYGKGSGTRTFRLFDGSAINITIFEYILPAGGRVEGVGLAPDIESVLDPEAQTVPLARLPIEDDNQLQDALEYFASGLADQDIPEA